MASALGALPHICLASSSPIGTSSRICSTSTALVPSFGRSRKGWRTWHSRRKSENVGVVRMGLRAVESYDASFKLLPECEEKLLGLLSSDAFCSQVAEQAGKGSDVKFSFTGELFQPVPWSPTSTHGMPEEYEKYLDDKDNYLIINVPPNFMFQAKIFRPSRLCAVYRRVEDLDNKV